MARAASFTIGAICTLTACGAFDPAAPPPYGEALLVVDTDLPVPRVASRLRIDVYTNDGIWFASRDDVRPDPRDWPVSFSVYTDDDARGRVVLVRLRAYLDGRQVPYRGELALQGAPTPALEPDPALTVDRIVRIRLEPGVRGRVPVVLHGACAGEAARLAPIAEAATCTDGAGLAAVSDAVLEDSLATDVPRVTGTYGDEPCAPDPPASERVCVPGGAFVLGDAFYRPTGTQSPVDSRPERIVRMSRFAMDRDEVTVGRFRAALSRGFTPPKAVGVTERDGPPGAQLDACTFSAAPRGRERYALSCVSWVTAKAFCEHEGGTLPTEARWEYAALAALRARKTIFPWGDDPPTCARAVYERGVLFHECADRSAGPVAVDDPTSDVNALGLRNLGGGLGEHTADSHAPFLDPCWTSAPAVDPSCTIPAPPECLADPESLECRVGPGWHHTVRGGDWENDGEALRGAIRSHDANAGSKDATLGFRCVYSAP